MLLRLQKAANTQTNKNTIITAWRKPEQNEAFSSPQLVLAHSVATDPQNTFLHYECCRKHHLQKCFSKLLRECMEIVSLFQARGRIHFLQDSACTHIHLERICIIKSQRLFLAHTVFKVGFFLFKNLRCKAGVFKLQKHSTYRKFFSSEEITDVRQMQ